MKLTGVASVATGVHNLPVPCQGAMARRCTSPSQSSPLEHIRRDVETFDAEPELRGGIGPY
jgi:hypothetical protein